MTNVAASYSHSSSLGGQLRLGNRRPRAGYTDLDWRSDDPLKDSRDIFARNLKFWMEKRGISGAELGRRLDVSRAAVSSWLTKQSGPEVRTLGDIARILDIPVHNLFYDAEDKRRPVAPPPEDEDEKALKHIAKRMGREIRVDPKKI